MDNNEATSTLMLRIQNLDPENACKIMGYILLQDPGEKEMIRLALGPETLLINLINKAKSHLGISSNTISAPCSPPVFNPQTRSFLNQTSPRIIIPSPPSIPWSPFSNKLSVSSPSYASAVVNGTTSIDSADAQMLFETKNINFMDSPSARSDSIVFPFDHNGETHHSNNLHRRSFSVSDVYQDNDDEGDSNGGWKPCMYFARGFCKNGSHCKFLHDLSFDEFLRYKAHQHQQFAAASQRMAASVPYNRCMNFLHDNQRSAAAALMMGEEYLKFGRCRPDRSDFMFGGNPESSARQIYLTFPADSTFKEEDVSRYFGTYGPVQDVRIPYQQKRMFGFVTFLYPETVKQILAHGNPHFVCDSRVLVKPYKEKGKLPDKKLHMERGDFAECLSPRGLDLAEPYDPSLGGRLVYNSDEMMLRRKLQEQADLEQAIECHGRRLMNFQLLGLPNRHPNHQLRPHLVAGVPTYSPTHTYAHVNHNIVLPSDDINQEFSKGSNGGNDEANSPEAVTNPNILQDVNEIINNGDCIGIDMGDSTNLENSNQHGSLEHILPDNLFASPTKSASDRKPRFCASSAEPDGRIPETTTPVSTLDMASAKPCYVEMPRKVLSRKARTNEENKPSLALAKQYLQQKDKI